MTRLYLLAAQRCLANGWHQEANNMLRHALRHSNREHYHGHGRILAALSHIRRIQCGVIN